MTQRSQLTGDPLKISSITLKLPKSAKNLKPLQLNPEAVMEVAATAKTITVVVVKIPRQARPQKPKGLLEEFASMSQKLPARGY